MVPVERAEVPVDGCQGKAVGHQVVHDEAQHVVVGRQPEQDAAEHRSLRDDEGPADLLVHPRQGRLLGRTGRGREVDQRQREGRRPAVLEPELAVVENPCPQNRVPLQEAVEGRVQSCGVKRSTQSQRCVDVEGS